MRMVRIDATTRPAASASEALIKPLKRIRGLLNRLPQFFFEVMRIPGAMTGFKYIKHLYPGLSESSPKATYVRVSRLSEAKSACYPLPVNISDRAELKKQIPERLNLSFWSIPEMKVDASSRIDIANARIVKCANEWERDSYCILHEEKARIVLTGTEYRDGHRAILRGHSASRTSIKGDVFWALCRFPDSYFRWITHVLPRIIQAMNDGVADRMIMPHESHCPKFMGQALEVLGINRPLRFGLEPEQVVCEKLVAYHFSPFDPVALDGVRREFTRRIAPHKHGRRIFISRSKARWRRMANEEQIWNLLRSAGFERVVAEELSFVEQVRLMSEATALVSLHGAGLSNMVFCDPAALVVEMADLGRPNPHFYALASAMGHRYGLIETSPIDPDADPLYRDVRVDERALRGVLEKLN